MLAGFTSQPQASCDCVSHTLTQYARMKESSFFSELGLHSNSLCHVIKLHAAETLYFEQ
jgi:hypothetical protein